MQIKENPFDRDAWNIPLIRFITHTGSLSRELLSGESAAHRLVKLNCFEEIEIIPLPTTDNDVRKILDANGLIYTEYQSYESGVALKASDGSIYGVTSQPPQNLWGQVVPVSTVTLADILASNIGDYLVVGVSDPVLAVDVAEHNIITAERALEMVRILLAAHGRFYIHPKEPVNEGFYYLYRFKNLFTMFQHAWTIAVYAHGKGLPEKIFDYLDSLGRRLEFICRAHDKIAFFSLKTANNDTQDNQLYHLAYFVMLITGVFDDLARIIKEFYQLKINDRWDVNLRIPQGKKATKFYQALQFSNAKLSAFLTAENVQSEINAFYPIRDSLQHRELVKGIQYNESSKGGKNLFELSNEAAQSLAMASIPSNCIVRLHKSCLDPLLFITWVEKVITKLVNGVLSSINWDSVCETLPEHIQSKIRESDQRFKQGCGKFLGLLEDPWYF